jgi:hypothetical protein
MDKHTRLIVDAATGEQRIEELTEHQFRCERLGMPDDTPQDVVNAAWAARNQQQQAADRGQHVLQAAAERLKAYNPQAITDALPLVEDDDARRIFAEMNSLIADLRLVIVALVR